MTKEECGNCVFWLRWNESSGKQVWGNCRWNPGQLVVVGGAVKVKQPLKHEGDWCGQWERTNNLYTSSSDVRG